MKGEDQLCGVCPKHHTEKRPPGLELSLSMVNRTGDDEQTDREHNEVTPVQVAGDMSYTGPDAVCRQLMLDGVALERFEADLVALIGCCLLCHIKGKRSFDHEA